MPLLPDSAQRPGSHDGGQIIERRLEIVVDDQDFLDSCKRQIIEARTYTENHLRKNGFEPIPSETNFLIFPIKMNGEAFLDSMREKGVAVRAFNFWEKDWCRVSIGTMDEMKQFTSAIGEVLL